MVHLEKTGNIFRTLLELQEKGEKICLVTVVRTRGSVPRETGARMIVRAGGRIAGTIGGGKVEQLVIRDALRVLRNDKPLLVEYGLEGEKRKARSGRPSGMICGGRMMFFIESVGSCPSLYIFGAGHIARSLYRLALLGFFSPVIIDDRKEYASRDSFPCAREIHCGPYPGIVKKIRFRHPAYAVIMTEAHTHDEDVLRACLDVNFPFRYLGMVASGKTASEIREHLRKKGYSRGRLGLLHSPAGVPMASKAPEEIALSIMAEMIRVKNGVEQ